MALRSANDSKNLVGGSDLMPEKLKVQVTSFVQKIMNK
jgi:hypothetical protein